MKRTKCSDFTLGRANMICIICLQEKDSMSVEHIFPDAIGGTLTINNVCKQCNDKLGHDVDIHLLNHFFIKGERMRLNLKGKSGKTPNIFENAVLADDPSRKVRYEINHETNQKKVYLLPSVKKEKHEDGTLTFHISADKRDMTKIPAMINKMLKREGKHEVDEDEIYNKIVGSPPEIPTLRFGIEFNLTNYKRSILKIVYELGCYWLGESYANDATGEIIRNCFLDKSLTGDFSKEYPVKGSIELLINRSSNLNFWTFEPNNHIAYFVKISSDIIWCYVRIFSVFEGGFEVSQDGRRYPDFGSNFISLNPINKENRESTFEEELARIIESLPNGEDV
jgi:hypothetical protein